MRQYTFLTGWQIFSQLVLGVLVERKAVVRQN
jgi:hypothetical protein